MALNPVIPGRVSDELWGKSIGVLNANPLKFSGGYKTKVIHLIDATSRGYISPAEAYDALDADYFPSFLEVRNSAYAHLIR
jgi:hypothetical protein